MANPIANSKVHIPKGLQSLLVGLSMEVLRHQPSNIPAFAADYFEKLLRERGKISFDFFLREKLAYFLALLRFTE